MNQIFLPLRSNAGWFRGQENRTILEKRIKNYLVLYDKIIVQDGRYECTIGESGSIDFIVPPNTGNIDRTKIDFFQPGQTFNVSIGPEGTKPIHSIMGGKVDVSFDVDFYPILNDAGLTQVDYIQWLNIDIDQKSKGLAQREATRDERDEVLRKTLPNNYFQRKNILVSLYIDSLLASAVNLPFLVDNKILELVRWKNEQAKQNWLPALRDVFHNVWVSLEHPDFGDLSWDEICNIRESPIGKSYRQMIQRVTEAVAKALPDLKSEQDISDLVHIYFHKELVNELKARQTKLPTVILNIGLNLLSLIGIVTGIGAATFGSVKEIRNFVKDKNSWISLLGPKKPN